MGTRIYALDSLKWFIIWLMVVFHAAICYMTDPPEGWYVLDPGQPLFSAELFVRWADVFIMPVMFFISGYFGAMSLRRHGAAAFVRGRFYRIFLPWMVCVACLAPLTSYSRYVSRDPSIGLGGFLWGMIQGATYEQACYWYLSALMALYALLLLAVWTFPGILRERPPVMPSRKFFFFLFLVSFLGSGTINLFADLDAWSFYGGGILILQTTRIPIHIAMFAAGVWAWRQGWLLPGGYLPSSRGWGAWFLATSILYLWQRFRFPYNGPGEGTEVWMNAFFHVCLMMAATFFFLGFFCRFLNRWVSLLGSLSATSYAVYLVHQPILFYAELALRMTSLPAVLKLILACVLTLGLSHVLGRAFHTLVDRHV